jgi:23S rRNA-/tRNA-specific pseudouridylate synthase
MIIALDLPPPVEIVAPSLGLRYVEPYPHTFPVFAKGRWLGRKLIDVFAEEFRAFDRAYYLTAMASGRLTVNGAIVEPDYVLRPQDSILHLVHKHEPPCSSEGYAVLGRFGAIVGVQKPASLPVHPCGRSMHLSLLPMIRRDLIQRLRALPAISNTASAEAAEELVRIRANRLNLLHRLDRLTSGVVLFSDDPAAAASVRAAMQSKQMFKVYLARVRGRFPSGPTAPDGAPIVPCAVACTAPLVRIDARRGAFEVPESWSLNDSLATAGTSLDLTRAQLYGRSGLFIPPGSQAKIFAFRQATALADALRVTGGKHVRAAKWRELADHAEDPKECVSVFSLLRYDPGTDCSLVVCRPLTGRTHQLRVHLQALGHPIVNDAHYGGDPDSLPGTRVDLSANVVAEATARHGAVVGNLPPGLVAGPAVQAMPWYQDWCPICTLLARDPNEEQSAEAVTAADATPAAMATLPPASDEEDEEDISTLSFMFRFICLHAFCYEVPVAACLPREAPEAQAAAQRASVPNAPLPVARFSTAVPDWAQIGPGPRLSPVDVVAASDALRADSGAVEHVYDSCRLLPPTADVLVPPELL